MGVLDLERAGSWNLKVGRDRNRAVADVLTLLRTRDLDWLVIQEAAQYIDRLQQMLVGTGWTIIVDERDISAKDSAVIIKNRILLKHGGLHRLGGIRWERNPGRIGLHRPRSATSANVYGLKVLDVHLPPGPFTNRFPLRRRAFRVACRRVRHLARYWKREGRSFILAGDWNMGKHVEGTWLKPTPRWIAKTTGSQITGNSIDYVMSNGVTVLHYTRLVGFGQSDHWPVLFEVVR